MFISRNSAQLFTVEFGSGPRTILAIGGWTGSWELWTGPFQYLSKTWRTVAYDHRGTGATLAPTQSISMENMVDDLFAVMDKMGIAKCVLAAESAGGMVAIQAVLQQPQRFEGLVLVDALLHQQADEKENIFLQGLEKDFNKTIEQFVYACVPEEEENSVEIRSWGRKILFRSSPDAAIRLFQCIFGFDMRPALAQIRIPTLVLHGDQDVIVPVRDSEFASSQILNSRMRVFKGAGHVPTLTCPGDVAEEINQFFRKEERYE